MFVRANFVDIYSQGMRDRSMRSETELAREIKLTDWSMAGNLSNRSSGVQILHDICTRLKRYLYSAKCSWIINSFYKSYFYSGAKMYCRTFHPYLHSLALNHHSYRSYRSNVDVLQLDHFSSGQQQVCVFPFDVVFERDAIPVGL